ncbi:MAG: alpha/beta hydrolase fold domain-containing protein, partial [Acidimicrobiia bacterium]|nr:alpha/beta hydrolase fold domain-containing protein [Acidimicrobiia bacterium]
MAVDPNLQLLLSAMQQGGTGSLSEMGVEQARQMIKQFDAFAGADRVELPRVEDLTAPGPAGAIPLRLYSPAAEAALPVVVYLHGGGWVIGDIESHDSICRKLAQAATCTVI